MMWIIWFELLIFFNVFSCIVENELWWRVTARRNNVRNLCVLFCTMAVGWVVQVQVQVQVVDQYLAKKRSIYVDASYVAPPTSLSPLPLVLPTSALLPFTASLVARAVPSGWRYCAAFWRDPQILTPAVTGYCWTPPDQYRKQNSCNQKTIAAILYFTGQCGFLLYACCPPVHHLLLLFTRQSPFG